MRRIFTAIASIILTFVISATMLVGCNLVSVNSERDMKQEVATVQIDSSREADVIYKKDLVIAYLNYYYMYEQYYGYSRAETFELIVDELIKNRVFVQNAIKYFSEKSGTTTVDWDISKYLSNEEKDDAIYSAYKDMNDFIDSYVTDKEDEKLSDTYDGTVRVVPTGATNDEELDASEKAAYVQKGIDVTERRSAFNKAIKVLQQNELLGDYDGSDITTTEYYKQTLENYYESKIIENFEQSISAEARAKVTYAKLQETYADMYNKQKAWTLDEFITAIGALSTTSDPIVYSGYEGYGMVYHILLKASDAQLAEIDDWKKENPNYTKDQLKAKREQVFANIQVTDQRASWINSGYDFDGAKFMGDYTFVENDSLEFKGTVVDLTPSLDADDKEYRAEIKDSDVMTVSEFVTMMEDYLYDVKPTALNLGGIYKTSAKAESAKPDFENRIKELMFAFSNDDSDTALNTFKGYDITPIDADSSWEKEFAEGGRELLKGTCGDYGYVMVATSYGYHIMFLSEKFDAKYDYKTLEDYLTKEYGAKDWQTYYNDMLANWDEFEDTTNYLYVLMNNVSSTVVNNALTQEQNRIKNTYINAGDYVVLNESAYAELVS